LQRPPWRYGLAIGLTMLCALAMILWGTTFTSQATQGVVTEVGSWVVFTGVFCWLAWFRQPHAKRRAILTFGLWAAVAITVNLAAKHGLNQHFLALGLANSPRLYWAGLFFIPPILLFWHAQRDQQLQNHGLHLRKWPDQLACLQAFSFRCTFSRRFDLAGLSDSVLSRGNICFGRWATRYFNR